MAHDTLTIPVSLVSQVDAGRLFREVEALDDNFRQREHHSHTSPHQPSAILAQLLTDNQLTLDDVQERERLKQFLTELRRDAPVVHMSFAAEPGADFVSKIITWLRAEIHPLALLDIGLQPSIAAGCIIRTNSKYFDCSMRQHLVNNRPKLVNLIQGVKQHA